MRGVFLKLPVIGEEPEALDEHDGTKPLATAEHTVSHRFAQKSVALIACGQALLKHFFNSLQICHSNTSK